ncbi:MAG: helix-turn-helix transcriptional regulator [Ruminococcaceae bacterium]|nr:helix-turn-helix transcriptional regulator [Oscillospiraceae bacterium]
MIHPEQLGARIASKRKILGLTQGQVAAYMGVSPQAVSKWERGLACPDLVFLDELAELLDMGLEELLLGSPAQILASA